MKTTIKLTGLFALVIGLVMSCEDVQNVTPAPNANPSNLSANFLFVNASPDAPSLDLYVNGLMTGTSVGASQGQSSYTNVGVTTNGVGSNSSIRAKATTGTIGGNYVKDNDLIFRASSTNVNNFTATDGAYYTVIAVDTINRPKPIRTVNSLGFGDVTYYAPVTSFTGKTSANADTVIQLSPDFNNSIVTFNLCKKYNNNVAPSFFVPLGSGSSGPVPLGSTDLGGPRFLVITDFLPAPATSPVWPVPSSGKFAVRFVNASPNAGNTTCQIGTTFFQSGSPLANTIFTYPMVVANFNPSVGSRSTTVGYTNNFAASGSYTITATAGAATTSLAAQTFADGGVYTIVLTGSKAKKTLALSLIRNK